MAYDRYPVERRSNQPLPPEEPNYYSGQPESRTRFYRDKRNGKLMGVCAGIADYTGFDVSLVRVCFLAAMFMSGGAILPFYFIAGDGHADQAALHLNERTARNSSSGRASAPRPPALRATSVRG